MSKRLRLAKNLLKETGVIFISIDDNEYAQLKMLCDNYIFSEKNNYVGTITWERKRKGSHLSKKFTKKTEYILIYAPKGRDTELFGADSGKEEDQPLIKRTNSRKELIIPKDLVETKLKDGVYVKGNYGKGTSSVKLLEDVQVDNGKFLNDLRLEGPFIWTQSNLDYEVSLGARFFIRTKNFSLRALKGEESQGFKALSSLFTKDVGTNEDAKTEIANILGVSEDAIGIDYPKPTNLILKLLDSYRSVSNFTVLDFFAGSGTTAHSLLMLNMLKNTSNKFILCTNNEENICRKVCYPRIKNIIKGFGSVKGLKGNLKYYKTAFVKKTISRDDLKMRITRECTEMLCMREGIFEEVKANPDYHIFEQSAKVMGVYYSVERDSLGQLKEELDRMEGEKILYCFTFDPLGLDKSDFADWQGVSLEPIPQKILDIYEQIYEY